MVKNTRVLVVSGVSRHVADRLLEGEEFVDLLLAQEGLGRYVIVFCPRRNGCTRLWKAESGIMARPDASPSIKVFFIV